MKIPQKWRIEGKKKIPQNSSNWEKKKKNCNKIVIKVKNDWPDPPAIFLRLQIRYIDESKKKEKTTPRVAATATSIR